MADSSQVQKAGSGALQVQVGTVITGIDEKRAREICDEKIACAIKDLTSEARSVAEKRISDLVVKTLAKIQERKVDMSSFADPKFQRELIKAQSSAAASDRKSDVEMLSELLVARMDGKLQRKTHTGISRAIEIVSDVDDDELLALTAVHAVGCYYPSSIKGHSIKEGLFALNRLYEQLKVSDLPQGEGWMENLNMLDAIIISPIGGFKKIVEYFEVLVVIVAFDNILEVIVLVLAFVVSDSTLEVFLLEGYFCYDNLKSFVVDIFLEVNFSFIDSAD